MNVRNKGAAGERELCKLLWTELEDYLTEKPERNVDQVRYGGSDIVNVPGVFIEVKRVQNLDLQKWWIQVKTALAKSKSSDVPIVAFRQNGTRWEFLLPASLIGLELGYLRVTREVFINWMKNFLLRMR